MSYALSSYLIQLLICNFVVLIFFLPIRLKMKKKKGALTDTVFVCWLVSLLALTVLPMMNIMVQDRLIFSVFFPNGNYVIASNLGIKKFFELPIEHSLQLMPFSNISHWISSLADGSTTLEKFLLNIAANVAAFIPLGFIPAFKRRPFKFTAIIGIVIILAIEAVQYFTGRTADIDDVILDYAGVLIGCLFGTIASKLRKD